MKKMILMLGLSVGCAFASFAQKSKVTVLNVDSKGINLDASQVGNLVRLELDKLDTFEVMDRYDVKYVIDKNKINIDNCYGKLCLVETGKLINADKMFTGSVELYGKTIIVTLKMIDVKKEVVEKTEIIEFLALPEEIQSMLNITVRRMFGQKEDLVLIEKLTKKNNFESAINTPNSYSLKLGGPRMGFVAFTGNQARLLSKSKDNGGYDAFPMMFQFGYQFEKQYLNEGNFQALFEFIPMVTGLDQGQFFPSFSILNGLRSNVSGWEFAFGPTFSFDKKAEVFEYNGVTYVKDDFSKSPAVSNPVYTTQSDSRGSVRLNSNFIIALGKTFKSGKMNIPVNCFFIPAKDGLKFGVSFGYNARKEDKK
ncbi:MAG: hypothetical protein RLZZ175_672 [Bacteroidota bacterium]|jgi:hypothetical protein